jgi:acyl carrier protein
VTHLVHELHSSKSGSATLDSTLEHDLGLDSLGRMELLARLERALDVRLPEHFLVTADTVRDILQAVQQASASGPPAPLLEGSHAMPESMEAPPLPAGTLLEVLDWYMRAHPHRLHITLSGAVGHMDDITYAALYEGATEVAVGLQAQALQPGHTVALMSPTCRNLVVSL